MATTMYRTDNTRIQILKWVPPSYKIAHMIASKGNSEAYRITFAIAPTSMNENRTNNMQMSKTNGGWFGQPMGPSPIPLSFEGYMLDVEGYLEKHIFLNNWANYLQAKKTNKMEYASEYKVKFLIGGREYHGYMQSISIQTSSQRPFAHQYSGVFIALSDKYIYKPEQLKVTTALGAYAVSTQVKAFGRNTYAILTK